MRNWSQHSWDIHVHAAPSLFERWGTAWELAEECQEAGMKGFVLKYHHGSTVELASILNDQFPQLSILGGTTLNYFVGGLNPHAVQATLTLGGKIIWLPTIHSVNHTAHVGPMGGFNVQNSKVQKAPEKGITILSDKKTLVDPMREILSLLHNQPVALSSGHLSFEEIRTLVAYIEDNNLTIRLVVGHVSFKAPSLSLEQIKELVRDWVWFEESYVAISSLAHFKTTSAQLIAERIKEVPHARWILSTDSGQKDNLKSPHAINEFATQLEKNGLSEKTIEKMLRDEPQNLLR